MNESKLTPAHFSQNLLTRWKFLISFFRLLFLTANTDEKASWTALQEHLTSSRNSFTSALHSSKVHEECVPTNISLTFKCMCGKNSKVSVLPALITKPMFQHFLVCVLIFALRGTILYILTNEWHNKVQAAYLTGFGRPTEHK